MLKKSREKETERVNAYLREHEEFGGAISSPAESHFAKLEITIGDYTSGIGFLSAFLGCIALAIAASAPGMIIPLRIGLWAGAVGLFVIALKHSWKYYARHTAQKIAFEIHRTRSANAKYDDDKKEILEAVRESGSSEMAQQIEAILEKVNELKRHDTAQQVDLAGLSGVSSSRPRMLPRNPQPHLGAKRSFSRPRLR